MRIDAHQHYWLLERGDYGWLTPEAGVLYRDYLPGELEPLLQQNQVDRTILVQAAPTVGETQYMLSLADEHPSIAGVVGWVDMESDPQALESQLEQFMKHPKFVGVRPMLQDYDADYIVSERLLESFAILERMQVNLDWLVQHPQLPSVLQVMKRFPNLRSVIDHLANPPIQDGVLEPWASQMEELAQFPQLYCKLSGMVVNIENGTAEHFKPYVQHCIQVFGWDRVMFGSDWPVCLLAEEYGAVVRLLEESLPAGTTEEQRSKLFGGNAAAFYQVK